MRKYAIIGTAVIAAILFVFYQNLGGLSDVNKEVVTVHGYELSGKSFKGRYSSQDLEQIFYEIKELNQPLLIVNYPLAGDSTEKGFLNQFIAVESNDQPDLELKILHISQAVRATIDAHNLVMPKPHEVEESLRIYAKEKGLTLEDYTIERYESDRELIIEIPVKE